MNYNEEIFNELKSIGIGGQLIDMPEKDKGTREDYAELRRKSDEIDKKNLTMFRESSRNAKYSLPCGSLG